jgi:hypothetical protein
MLRVGAVAGAKQNRLPLQILPFSLLPDGRIFGQITQKRPQKIVHGRKKLEAVKCQNLAKSGRKEAGKYFFNFSDEKHIINCDFLDFVEFFWYTKYLKTLFYTAFVKLQNFWKFSGYFGRKGSKQYGNSDPF